MKCIVINGKHTHSEHPVMDADVYRKDPRILSASAYSLLYDANLIAAMGGTPQTDEWDDSMPDALLAQADLIVAPHAVTDDIERILVDLAQRGKKIFWVRPSAAALDAATGGAVRIKRTLHSHCERWELPGGSFIWPQPVDYDTYSYTEGASGRWLIGGDWPSVVRYGNCAFGAGGVFHAFNWYWNSPLDTIREDGLFNAFHRMFLGEIAALLDLAWDDGKAKENFFIRRDFHAYGFARMLVTDLYRMHGRTPDFAAADSAIAKAAALVGNAEEQQIEAALKPAFEELYRMRKAVVAIPAYYAEALHGGILTDEYGYIEIASPEFVKEQMETLMYFARRRRGHFSVDISIATLVHMDDRHPSFTKLFKEGMDEGIFEVANGSIGQPYPPLFSWESNIRQFETGQKAMKRLYGRGATTLLAQEMQLVPSYPAILAQGGYTGAIHRIQNKGSVVYDEEDTLLWQSPDGSKIPAVPTQYGDSEHTIAMVHLHWPRLISDAAKTYSVGVFTNLLDNTWNTPFREESNRACFYAPVFGEFVTYRELFEKLPKPKASRVYRRDEYLPELQAGTSVMLSDMQRVNNALEGIEKYMALIGSEAANGAVETAWNRLGEYQNHDNTVCFGVAPRLRYCWPESHGPVRTAPNLYDLTKDETFAALRACEAVIGGKNALFNTLDRPRAQTLVAADGKITGLKRLRTLEGAAGALSAELPAHGMIPMPHMTGNLMKPHGDNTMDNGALRVRVDLDTGALASVVDIETGNELLGGPANALSIGLQGGAKLLSLHKSAINNVQMIQIRVELRNGEGTFAGWADSSISMAEGEKRIYVTTSLEPWEKLSRPYRPYEYARKTGLYAHFTLASRYDKARDCWLHQISDAPDGTRDVFGPFEAYGNRLRAETPPHARTQSAMGLVMQGGDDSVILHNDGAQIYEIDGSRVSQLLWNNCDYDTVISYAMEWTEDKPFARMLDYQYDLLPVKNVEAAQAPRVEDPAIWISSIRRIGGSLYVRLVEIEGSACEAALVPGGNVRSAQLVDILGEPMQDIEVKDGVIPFSLGANGFCTIKLNP